MCSDDAGDDDPQDADNRGREKYMNVDDDRGDDLADDPVLDEKVSADGRSADQNTNSADQGADCADSNIKCMVCGYVLSILCTTSCDMHNLYSAAFHQALNGYLAIHPPIHIYLFHLFSILWNSYPCHS